ncbi:MAG: BtpA/SgcQ family protein [Planctomycetota bacterium JB042]
MARVSTWWGRTFGTEVPAIGVVHLPALPGSPNARRPIDRIADQAAADARLYLEHGLHGVIVENFGDAPFEPGAVPPHVVASMTRVAVAVREAAGGRPVGVNVLRNDARAALAVAAAAGLDFLRVNVLAGTFATDQGLIQGDAAGLLRERRAIGAAVRVFADVRVKHAAPLREAPLDVEVEELVGRAGADAVLVTGATTGRPPDRERLGVVARAAGRAPVVVASGADPRNVAELAADADGFVVGTALKAGGRTTARPDPARVERFAEALARAVRG